MSPNVGNFVHDLVEMAKAMETLPQVQLELDHAKLDQHNLSVEIDRLKADLEQSRTYAASLEQKVRDTEVARDDAELRFLELDEKAHSVLAAMEVIQGRATWAHELLNPPKPQPEPEAQPQTADVGPGPSEAPPTPTSQSGSSQDIHGASEAPQPPVSQGQGEVNPTANTGQPDIGLTLTETSPAEPAKPLGRYANKRYYDHPVYVPLWDWIDGGGTEDSYRWKPVSF